MSKPCSKCKGEMSLKVLDPFHGEEGGLSLTVHGMPSLACAAGHLRFTHIEFAALLMDLMANPANYSSIPSAKKKGLFKKHYHCPFCEKELPETADGHQQVEVAAEIPKSDQFRVVIKVPVFRCGCGKHSIHSGEEVGRLAFKSIEHAYRSIDIHPT